jgi:hypothetical protein
MLAQKDFYTTPARVLAQKDPSTGGIGRGRRQVLQDDATGAEGNTKNKKKAASLTSPPSAFKPAGRVQNLSFA